MQEFIAIDPYAKQDLPADVSDWEIKAVFGLGLNKTTKMSFGGGEEAVTKAKVGTVLDRWDVETHIYKGEAVSNVGFFAKLFGAKAQAVKAGVTQEAKSYRIDTNDKGRQIEVGAAVRLAVATSSMKAEFELSVPNLAAAAQLGLTEAKIGIYVVGYAGPIGDILPAPKDLNVENFGDFTAAFAKIQARVFSPEYTQYISPTLLGYIKDDSGA